MFEALNAIDRRYESYLGMAAADPNASQDAAAATAAYQVLLAHFPAQKTALDDSYAITLETVGDQRARESGIAIGKAAAALALKAGGIDPAIAADPLSAARRRPASGCRPSCRCSTLTSSPSSRGSWTRADSVRPGPPPALTSERWARDYDEVKRLGGKESKERTAARDADGALSDHAEHDAVLPAGGRRAGPDAGRERADVRDARR